MAGIELQYQLKKSGQAPIHNVWPWPMWPLFFSQQLIRMRNRTPHSNGNGISTPSSPATDHDQLIARLLGDSKKAEALKWLEGVKVGKRTIGSCRTSTTSARLVRTLYSLGAVKIIAAQIQPARNMEGQHAGKLVVKLPTEAQRRKAIFDWCQKQGDSLGFSPELDHGESHLFLLLD